LHFDFLHSAFWHLRSILHSASCIPTPCILSRPQQSSQLPFTQWSITTCISIQMTTLIPLVQLSFPLPILILKLNHWQSTPKSPSTSSQKCEKACSLE
jgi:hypothetical protein